MKGCVNKAGEVLCVLVLVYPLIRFVWVTTYGVPVWKGLRMAVVILLALFPALFHVWLRRHMADKGKEKDEDGSAR